MATRYFHWSSVFDCVMHETNETGATAVTYTHEPSQYGPLLSENRGGTEYYHHYDALGSTTMLTDNTGAVTDTFQYDAWGNDAARTGTTPTPYTWVGRWGYQYDSFLGSYYIRARDYQPQIIRWTSVDPVWQYTMQGMYLHALNHPTIEIDPSGLKCCVCGFILPPLGSKVTDLDQVVSNKEFAALRTEFMEYYSRHFEVPIMLARTTVDHVGAYLFNVKPPSNRFATAALFYTGIIYTGECAFSLTEHWRTYKFDYNAGTWALLRSGTESVWQNSTKDQHPSLRLGWDELRKPVSLATIEGNTITCRSLILFADTPGASHNRNVVKPANSDAKSQFIAHFWKVTDPATGFVAAFGSNFVSLGINPTTWALGGFGLVQVAVGVKSCPNC